jgi:hypothetical protein
MVFEAHYHLNLYVKLLEEIESKRLKPRQYYATLLMREKPLDNPFSKEQRDKIEDILTIVERKVRKEVGDEDLEEVRDSMIDELTRLANRAKREEKRGKITIDNKKAYREKEEHVLDVSSLYKVFLTSDLINRSFVKGPVMTESYGSSTEGKAKALLEKIESSGVLSNLEEKERYLVALAVTKLLEKALSSVSSSPEKYKEWMREYASSIVKDSKPIAWQTPLGLEVQQVDFNSNTVRVSIDGGRRVEFKVYNDKINASAHKKGLSPNYIHSLDASHLMMTVNALSQRGISDIVTVHDSFATHANDVGVLSMTLREAFVALHQKEILPILTEFFEETFSVAKKKIPYVDQDGFELKEVLKSEYFFA